MFKPSLYENNKADHTWNLNIEIQVVCFYNSYNKFMKYDSLDFL